LSKTGKYSKNVVKILPNNNFSKTGEKIVKIKKIVTVVKNGKTCSKLWVF
jgi:hypothetical protein